MTFPIQRQSDTYGVFDDDGLRFAKEYHTRDLPEGLANMLAGPRITAGMNNPDNRRQAGDFDAQYDYSRPSISDLHAHDPHQMGGDEFDAEFPNGEPQYYTEEAFREQPQTPLQPLNEMLEHARRPDMEPPPHDYLAQFRPHIASFTEARVLEAGDSGPAPGLFTPMLFQPKVPSAASMLLGGEDESSEKAFINEAAAVQPQVVPGWIGHGYAPGHRVGLPWREQTIPGTVTHLDGQAVGIRWDDGQHSTEEPSDLRPL